ncbi:MAG: flagellar biosynthesis protein FliQ [Eubacterium sp.]|nr:flagellar biosynthesis protein FliQ [Eubacterium sp.]
MITAEQVIDLTRESIYLIIICGAPCLLVSLVVGLIVSIFQTVTSIQEQTLTFVPKILSVFVCIMIFGGWIMNNITTFMTEICNNFSTYLG